jgi:tetratricopeptide (TPR) repeat protein
MTRCPSSDRLQQLLADQLAGPEAEAVEAHVETCARCQQTLERLTSARHEQSGEVPVQRQDAAEETVSALLRRLEQAPPAGAAPPPRPKQPAENPTQPGASPKPGLSAAPAAATAEPGAAATGTPAEATTWPHVPGYVILGELGRGGMGVVYQARQQGLDRLVALKMVLAGEYAGAAERQRFRAEALAVARLSHPNVVQVFEVGEHDGRPYLALEYLAGGTLAHRLHSGPLPPREAAALLEPLARAVQAAHEKGVIHRDLKPANVLLTTDGAPKVSDFGLAKRLDGSAGPTPSGAVVGTPAYMAPEQAAGTPEAVGPASDVYALGAILYEALTGRPPFQAPTPVDTLLRVLSDEPPAPRALNPAVPRDLETITLKCLRKEPQKRYATAGELAEDLGRFLHGEPIRARPLSLAERLWRRRRRLLAAGLALLVLALLGAGTYALFGWQHERRDRAFDEAYERGVRQLEVRKANEAIASFNEALRLRPDSSLALTQRGAAYGLLGDYDRALADHDEAIRREPENALPYRRRGWVFLKLRRYEDAVTNLTIALERDQDQEAVSRQLRATAYLNLGRWPEAENDLDTAVRLAPRDAEISHLLSTLHAAQGRWDDAVRDYDMLRPSFPNYLFTRAAAALAGGDEASYRQGRDRLLALVEASSNMEFVEVLAARACALPEKTEIDPARLLRLLEGPLKEYEGLVKELRDNPQSVRARPNGAWSGVLWRLRAQALVWLRTGRPRDAVRQVDDLLKADPDHNPAIAHLLLSIAHKQLGDQEESDRAFERALRDPVPVSHVHDTLEYQILLREARKGRGQP